MSRGKALTTLLAVMNATHIERQQSEAPLCGECNLAASDWVPGPVDSAQVSAQVNLSSDRISLGPVTIKWALDLRLEAVARGERRVGDFVLRRLKRVNLPLWEKLQQLAGETTFYCRRYGKTNFFVWSYHPELGGHDPWPGPRFPRSEVCWDHLMSICTRMESATVPSVDQLE